LLKFTDYALQREWADYGFEKRSVLGPVGGSEDIKGEKPYSQFKTEEIIHELVRQPPLGLFHPRRRPGIVEWGENVGAMKVEFSPAGSSKAFVRRLIKDLQGEQTWVCKYIWPFGNQSGLQEKEMPVAHEMYEHLEKLSLELIDSAKRDYPEFDRLADKLTTAVRLNYPSYCMFPVGVKKINEDYYKIYFEFRGHGVLAPPRQTRIEQFDIDLFWDKKKGVVRCWGYNIESPTKGRKWIVSPSEWDEWFAPSQPIEEIVECVKRIFMTY
jgi:hypothetical protein